MRMIYFHPPSLFSIGYKDCFRLKSYYYRTDQSPIAQFCPRPKGGYRFDWDIYRHLWLLLEPIRASQLPSPLSWTAILQQVGYLPQRQEHYRMIYYYPKPFIAVPCLSAPNICINKCNLLDQKCRLMVGKN